MKPEVRDRPVALITGASSGIGRAFALLLAEEGWDVALLARRASELKMFSLEMLSTGGHPIYMSADVTDNTLTSAVNTAHSHFGRFDALIAAAGVGGATPGGAFDAALARHIIDVNATGFAATVAAVLPYMIERRAGLIIALSSLAGYRGLPGNAAYCGSKAFVRLLCESLRVDLRGTGVRVTYACPGWVRTPMIDGNTADMRHVLDPDETVRIIWNAAKKGRCRVDLPTVLGLSTRAGAHVPDFAFDFFMRGKTWPFAAPPNATQGAKPRPAPAGRPAALVTGASTGIGRALCLDLAARGYDMAMIARRPDVLEATADEARAAGATVHSYALDVTDETGLRVVFADFIKKTGRLDMVIANAGVGNPTPGRKFKFDIVRRQIDLNVNAFTATVAHALPVMRGQGFGRVVGISSLAAFRGLPEHGVYSGSKAYVAAFLESLRVDMRPFGVSVTTVFPGFVKTPMTDLNKFPMPFMMRAEDAARLILDAALAGRSRVAFPWQITSAMGLAKFLPDKLYDAVMGLKK